MNETSINPGRPGRGFVRLEFGDGHLYRAYWGQLDDKYVLDGWGEMQYADGSVYRGQWCGGQQSGFGQYIVPNTKFCEGVWSEGTLIKGLVRYDDTTLYKGSFRAGKYHGYGKKLFACGCSYEGQWANGEAHGQGCMEFVGQHSSLMSSYMGQWSKGLMHGTGTMHFTNRDIYHGQFCSDKRTGTGVFASAGGDMYFGGFKNDKRQGQGRYCWYNGDVLEGTFMDGEVCGQASLTSKRSDYRYDGTFKDHRMHKGKMTFSDGRVVKIDSNTGFQTSFHPSTSDRTSSVHGGLLSVPEQELHMPKAVSKHDSDGSLVKDTGTTVAGKPAKRGLFQCEDRAGEHGEEDTVAKKPRQEKTEASPLKSSGMATALTAVFTKETAAELIERMPSMPLGTQLQVDSMYSASSGVTLSESESAYTVSESQSDRIAPADTAAVADAVSADRASNQDSMSVKTNTARSDSESFSQLQLKLPPVRDILSHIPGS